MKAVLKKLSNIKSTKRFFISALVVCIITSSALSILTIASNNIIHIDNNGTALPSESISDEQLANSDYVAESEASAFEEIVGPVDPSPEPSAGGNSPVEGPTRWTALLGTGETSIAITGALFYQNSLLVLPSTLKGLPVTTITSVAFAGNYITGLTIPASVTNIALGAFMNCGSLAAFSMVEGNTGFSVSDGVLYNYDATILLCYPMAKYQTNFTIPSTVEMIEANAFYGVSDLNIGTALRNNCARSGWINASGTQQYKRIDAQINTERLFAGEYSEDPVVFYTTYDSRKYFYLKFGTYPQTVVSSESLVNALNNLTDDDKTGKSYQIGGESSTAKTHYEYEYQGQKYVLVTAENSIFGSSNNSTSLVANTSYWFKEPISWRIANYSNTTGVYDGPTTNLPLVASNVLTANVPFDANGTVLWGSENTNSELNSNMKNWLNYYFYNQAFSTIDKQNILLNTTFYNAVPSGSGSFPPQGTIQTTDHVWLPSYSEINVYGAFRLVRYYSVPGVTNFSIVNNASYGSYGPSWCTRSAYNATSVCGLSYSKVTSMASLEINPIYIGISATTTGVRPMIMLDNLIMSTF